MAVSVGSSLPKLVLNLVVCNFYAEALFWQCALSRSVAFFLGLAFAFRATAFGNYRFSGIPQESSGNFLGGVLGVRVKGVTGRDAIVAQ